MKKMFDKWKSYVNEQKFLNEFRDTTGYSLSDVEEHAPRPKHVTMNMLKFSSAKQQGTEVYRSNGTLFEGIEYEFGEGERGGIVVFSTDVNAVFDRDPQTALKKFSLKVRSVWQTLVNRVKKIQKLDLALKKTGQQSLPGEPEISGYSLGNFFTGRFKSSKTGRVYDEKSLSIEIIGINPRQLLLLSTEIAKVFKQESVLVKDHDSGKIYLADQTPVE
jgi:hypothetical protein